LAFTCCSIGVLLGRCVGFRFGLLVGDVVVTHLSESLQQGKHLLEDVACLAGVMDLVHDLPQGRVLQVLRRLGRQELGVIELADVAEHANHDLRVRIGVDPVVRLSVEAREPLFPRLVEEGVEHLHRARPSDLHLPVYTHVLTGIHEAHKVRVDRTKHREVVGTTGDSLVNSLHCSPRIGRTRVGSVLALDCSLDDIDLLGHCQRLEGVEHSVSNFVDDDGVRALREPTGRALHDRVVLSLSTETQVVLWLQAELQWNADPDVTVARGAVLVGREHHAELRVSSQHPGEGSPTRQAPLSFLHGVSGHGIPLFSGVGNRELGHSTSSNHDWRRSG
jgi:hypothetical protein